MTVRDLVFEALCTDSELAGLGYTRANIYPGWSRDSTPEAIEGELFMVLRWGTKEPGVGAVVPRLLDIWAYNKEPFFETPEKALIRCRSILAPLPGRFADPGWVLGVEWQGAGPDGLDEGYRAYYVSENYRITASGS
jgi:hypothetical protein